MFRVEVVSADGHSCGVPVQLDSHPAQVRPYVLNQIADSLLVDRQEIRRVLAEATATQLLAHLSKYMKDQLKPLHVRNQQTLCKRFFEPEGARGS
jgi:hypothetical protein